MFESRSSPWFLVSLLGSLELSKIYRCLPSSSAFAGIILLPLWHLHRHRQHRSIDVLLFELFVG
jgi:hypothetical protein